MKYIPRQVSNKDVADTTLDHTAVAESFIHLATAAPSKNEDEGTGYAVGCIWVDYSNGETYVCTSSTDEDSVWLAQDGSDDVNPPFRIQGSTYGYHYAWSDEVGPNYPDVVDRLALTSSGDASDVGERAPGSYTSRGSTRNTTHNYHAGYENGPATPDKAFIHRFPFTAPSSTTDVGEHSLGPSHPALGSSAGACDGTYGFICGASTPSPPYRIDHIEKFTMDSPAPSADSGAELTATLHSGAGASDIVGGKMFIAGGTNSPGPSGIINVIQQGAFSISSGTTSDWGDTVTTGAFSCTQSTTHGYAQAGQPTSTQICKFSFSSPGNATDVGDLLESKQSTAGCSSTTHGYRMGGNPGTNVIDNYPFASDDDASDVGDLTALGRGGSGCEI